MSFKDCQVGDRVRITVPYGETTATYEGPIVKCREDFVELDGHFGFYSDRGYDVEVIEKAKPKWQHGDVALYGADGYLPLTYCVASPFRADGWYWPDGGRLTMRGEELRLIFRDGKPVA